MRNLNIFFPFDDNRSGNYVRLSETSLEAVKSNIIHLLLTNSGERYYLPEFGLNLRKYIFEPNDDLTTEDIRIEVEEKLQRYFANLKVEKLTLTSEENSVLIFMQFTLNDSGELVRDEIKIRF